MKPLRYVILHHVDIAEPHFDLMFETMPGSDLATWRSRSWPIEEPSPVTRLRDHRRFFLQYEGVLSEQRGAVQRVADGECTVEIGEGDVITIKIINGATPTTLRLSKISDNQWQADVE
jgi:hypothetical protein